MSPLQTSLINFSKDSLSKAKLPHLRLFIRKGEKQGRKRKQRSNQRSCKSRRDMMRMIVLKTHRASHYHWLLLMIMSSLSQTLSLPQSNFQAAFQLKCSTKPTLSLCRKELGTTKMQTRVNHVQLLRIQMAHQC